METTFRRPWAESSRIPEKRFGPQCPGQPTLETLRPHRAWQWRADMDLWMEETGSDIQETLLEYTYVCGVCACECVVGVHVGVWGVCMCVCMCMCVWWVCMCVYVVCVCACGCVGCVCGVCVHVACECMCMCDVRLCPCVLCMW